MLGLQGFDLAHDVPVPDQLQLPLLAVAGEVQDLRSMTLTLDHVPDAGRVDRRRESKPVAVGALLDRL